MRLVARSRRNAYGAALHRLNQLDPDDPEVSFRIGLCEQALNHPEKALEGLGTGCAGFAVRNPRGCRAGDVVDQSSPVSSRRKTFSKRPFRKDGGHAARRALDRLYRLESRIDDVRKLNQKGWRISEESVADLKSLWNLDASPWPIDGLKTVLAAPSDDDRVWLARANLALLTGQFDEASRWLDECLKRVPGRPRRLAISAGTRPSDRSAVDCARGLDASGAGRAFGGRRRSRFAPGGSACEATVTRNAGRSKLGWRSSRRTPGPWNGWRPCRSKRAIVNGRSNCAPRRRRSTRRPSNTAHGFSRTEPERHAAENVRTGRGDRPAVRRQMLGGDRAACRIRKMPRHASRLARLSQPAPARSRNPGYARGLASRNAVPQLPAASPSTARTKPDFTRRCRDRRASLLRGQRRDLVVPSPRDHGRRRRPARLRRRRLARRLRRPGRPVSARRGRPVARRCSVPQSGRRHVRGRHRTLGHRRRCRAATATASPSATTTTTAIPTCSSPAGMPMPSIATGATAPSRT